MIEGQKGSLPAVIVGRESEVPLLNSVEGN